MRLVQGGHGEGSALFPSPSSAGPQHQPRTPRKASPPSDPALRTFLEEVGRMAADAVLERMHNSLNTKDNGERTIHSPRGFNSNHDAHEVRAETPRKVLKMSEHSFAFRVRERAIRRVAEAGSNGW